jgi:transposase
LIIVKLAMGMTGRYELSEAQFRLLEPYLPQNGAVGHPWSPHWPILNGLFWKLRSGAPWRDIPERYGPHQTIYDRYVLWRRDGTWDRILHALQVQLDADGKIDWSQFNVDSTVIRGSRAAAGARFDGPDTDEPADHALGRSRGGFGTKLHLLCDGNGVPLSALLLPGQAHESTQFEALVDSVAIDRSTTGRRRTRPRRVAADRAYHAQRIRHWLRTRGITAVIPPRKTQGKPRRGRPITYSVAHYRARNVIERCVGWLKECRSVATRFEKLAVNYLQMVKLAFIERYLRVLTA